MISPVLSVCTAPCALYINLCKIKCAAVEKRAKSITYITDLIDKNLPRTPTDDSSLLIRSEHDVQYKDTTGD